MNGGAKRSRAKAGCGLGVLLAAAVGLSARPVAALTSTGLLEGPEPRPALGREFTGGVQGAVLPAYRVVEEVSDGIFDFMRVHLVCYVLPGRLTHDLRAAPREDSGAHFWEDLSREQGQLAQSLRDAYPAADRPGASLSPDLLHAWRSRAVQEEEDLAMRVMTGTLLHRYGLDIFGRSYEADVKDPRHWDAGSLTMAGMVGAGLLYFGGLHTGAQFHGLRLKLDLRPGLRLQRAVDGGGTAGGLGRLELGAKGSPLSLALGWGLSGGRLRGETAGLTYQVKF